MHFSGILCQDPAGDSKVSLAGWRSPDDKDEGKSGALDHQPGEGRLVALTMMMGSDIEGCRSRGMNRKVRTFPVAHQGARGHVVDRGTAAAGGRMESRAETLQSVPVYRLVTTCRETGLIGRIKGALKNPRRIGALQCHAEGRGEGHVPWLDQVAPPQVRGIEAQFARRVIDDALRHVDGFRAPRAAVGVDRRRMGQHGNDARLGKNCIPIRHGHQGMGQGRAPAGGRSEIACLPCADRMRRSGGLPWSIPHGAAG